MITRKFKRIDTYFGDNGFSVEVTRCETKEGGLRITGAKIKTFDDELCLTPDELSLLIETIVQIRGIYT